MRLVRDAVALAIGLVFGAGVLALAQQAPPPGPHPASVPDWVLQYAGGAAKRAEECYQELAKEQDKSTKLTKDLADAKAAAAKAAPQKETK